LLAYLTRLTGDRAAAEDVVQESLVRAWKHADYLEKGTEARFAVGC
jgi:RNA polymerase sigma-70 factor (ECF subfamily)